MDGTFSLSISIPKQIFNKDYQVNRKTFGERLRKDRIDVVHQLKEFNVSFFIIS